MKKKFRGFFFTNEFFFQLKKNPFPVTHNMTSSSLSRSKVPQHLFFHIRSKSHSKLLTIFEYHVPSSVFLVMETDQDQDGPLFTFGEMKKNNTSQTHVQSGNVYAFLAFATKRGWNIRSFEKTGRFLIRTISNFYRNPVPTSTALSQPCLSEEKYDLTKNQTLVLEKKDHPFSYVDITQGFVEIQIQPLSFAAFLERETPFLTKVHSTQLFFWFLFFFHPFFLFSDTSFLDSKTTLELALSAMVPTRTKTELAPNFFSR
jgi:hypothetical protein